MCAVFLGAQNFEIQVCRVSDLISLISGVSLSLSLCPLQTCHIGCHIQTGVSLAGGKSRTHTCSPAQTESCEMTLEHVKLSLLQLVLNLRQLRVDMIGTSTHLAHVNIPPRKRVNTNTSTKPPTEPVDAAHHDKLHVLRHALFSHHRHG